MIEYMVPFEFPLEQDWYCLVFIMLRITYIWWCNAVRSTYGVTWPESGSADHVSGVRIMGPTSRAVRSSDWLPESPHHHPAFWYQYRWLSYLQLLCKIHCALIQPFNWSVKQVSIKCRTYMFSFWSKIRIARNDPYIQIIDVRNEELVDSYQTPNRYRIAQTVVEYSMRFLTFFQLFLRGIVIVSSPPISLL